MSRKLLFVVGVSSLLFAAPLSAALAADMAVKAPPPAPPPAYSWTGLYVGGTAGVVFGRSQHCDTPAFCTAGFSVASAAGGPTLGYNWQMNNWVVGLEADISGTNANGTTPTVPGVFGCGVGGLCFTNLQWFGTVRGRVGPTFNNWFPYVTAGLVYGRLSAGLGAAPTLDTASAIETNWTGGGGVEYALAPKNWSVKLEYLYFHLNNLFYDTLHICGSLSCTAVRNDFSVLRLGLNYRF